MPPPAAYFLTWTTYGTWLHGDPRGSVDDEHNTVGTPYLAPDPGRVAGEGRSRRDPPFVLDVSAREVVDQIIREHCGLRGWTLHACNVRSNHVHVVVSARSRPEEIMRQLKSWATRALRSKALDRGHRRLWTTHGSTRYVWNADDIPAAVHYVLNEQDRYRRG